MELLIKNVYCNDGINKIYQKLDGTTRFYKQHFYKQHQGEIGKKKKKTSKI